MMKLVRNDFIIEKVSLKGRKVSPQSLIRGFRGTRREGSGRGR